MRITNGWLDVALDGHYGAKSSDRAGYAPRFVVLHGTAGGGYAQSIDSYFSTSDVQASAHFIIGQDGTVIQGISCDMSSWSNGGLTAGHASFLPSGVNPNLYTISIEHVKSSTDNSNALTPIQAQKSFEVIKCICDAYGIPKMAGDTSGGVISHADLDPINRSRCPGPYPWEQLWDFLNNGGMTLNGTVYSPGKGDFAHWFTANDDNHWTCKQTGAIIRYNNLAFYRSLSIDGKSLPMPGLPLENEQEHIESDGYKWSSQQFERATMMFDPQHRKDSQPGAGGSYLAHVNPPKSQTITVEKIPSAIIADIQALKAASDKLAKDAQI